MSAHEEWASWSAAWQAQVPVDAARLARQVRHKRARMLAFTVLEVLLSVTGVGQTIRLLLQPQPGWRLKAWAVLALLLILGLQWLFLHIRRGTWSAAADGVAEMLELSTRRASAGIRLAWLQIWSTALLIAASLLLALPELLQCWRCDPHLLARVLRIGSVNGVVVALVFAGCAWYIRRQRRKLAGLRALLDAVRQE